MVMERGGFKPELSEAAKIASEKLEKVRYEVADTGIFAIQKQQEEQAKTELKTKEIEQNASTMARVEAIKAKLRGIDNQPKTVNEQILGRRSQEILSRRKEMPSFTEDVDESQDPTENQPAEVESGSSVVAQEVENTPPETPETTVETNEEREAFERWKIKATRKINALGDRIRLMTDRIPELKANTNMTEERRDVLRLAGLPDVSPDDFLLYQGEIARAVGRQIRIFKEMSALYQNAMAEQRVPEADAESLDLRFEVGDASVVRIDFSNPELVKQALAEHSGKEDYPPYRNLRNAINSGRPGRDWQFMGQDSKGNYLFIEANQAVEYDNGEQAKDHAIAISKKLVEEYAKMI